MNQIQLPGVIQIVLPGYTFEETNRCREIIHTLCESDFFKIRNGKATIHFDHQGTVQQIGMDIIQWKRDKSLTRLPPGARIEIVQPLTQKMSGAAK